MFFNHHTEKVWLVLKTMEKNVELAYESLILKCLKSYRHDKVQGKLSPTFQHSQQSSVGIASGND